MSKIEIHTLHDPEGKHPTWPDYWLAWADRVQGDGHSEAAAVENAKIRLAAGEDRDPSYRPK